MAVAPGSVARPGSPPGDLSLAGGRPRRLALRGPIGPLLAGVTAVTLALIVALVLGLGSKAVWVGALCAFVVLVVLAGVIAYIYWLTRDARDWELLSTPAPGAAVQPVIELGERIGREQASAALVAMLRDAHAQQRGAERFLGDFGNQLSALQPERAAGARVSDLVRRQLEQASAQLAELERRLESLGAGSSPVSDQEALAGVWLFEHLLADGVAGNARHAYALAELAAASYAVGERLARIIGERETGSVLAHLSEQAHAIAAAWLQASEAVLDLQAGSAGGNPAAVRTELIEQAQSMEELHQSLLHLTEAHARIAGNAAGSEDAGVQRLLWLIASEHHVAEDHRHQLGARSEDLGGGAAGAHRWGTRAAARTTALAETLRSFKLARDVRDLIVADRLEGATYDLLDRAARRAGDAQTAALAERLADHERGAAEDLEESLDRALEVALLAE